MQEPLGVSSPKDWVVKHSASMRASGSSRTTLSCTGSPAVGCGVSTVTFTVRGPLSGCGSQRNAPQAGSRLSRHTIAVVVVVEALSVVGTLVVRVRAVVVVVLATGRVVEEVDFDGTVVDVGWTPRVACVVSVVGGPVAVKVVVGTRSSAVDAAATTRTPGLRPVRAKPAVAAPTAARTAALT